MSGGTLSIGRASVAEQQDACIEAGASAVAEEVELLTWIEGEIEGHENAGVAV